MKKSFSFLLFTVFLFVAGIAQKTYIDSLTKIYEDASGALKVEALNKISFYYLDRENDKAIYYAKLAEQLATSGSYKKELVSSCNNIGIYYALI